VQERARLQDALEAATERKLHKKKQRKAKWSLAVEARQQLTALRQFGARND
jgi:hypothetical protein